MSVREAADSLRKASTPEPFSRSRTSNWVARGGGLPDYIQHIAHDLMEKRGKSESQAIQMAIGIVKNWASGKGKVDANTRAAAAKALAEWEKLKASNKAKKAVKETPLEQLPPADRAIAEAVEPPRFLFAELEVDEIGDLSVLEAKPDPDNDGDDDSSASGDTDSDMPKVLCPKCGRKVQPTSAGKCPTDGTDLSKAISLAKKGKGVSEAPKTYTPEQRRKAKTQPGEGDRYPIDNTEDLKRAIKAFGRSKTPSKTKAWIISRAKALGATNLLPAGWS